ncbi:glycerophosphodiester phosphodiesterase family protein [Catellatospora sp. KI3]|uniref:glycerophosphodiester phosphodiesterase n=1 Tax=Catellatospora sp. KI3 TaxID=3041620 RepID=UPI0024829DD0|nr:glycerophosphodiester phosphodiesterase family protein [Catellatospora sp. KI3]MDI1461737.1 glycerophosphodiester phosphodiesterase family protein [Catellatospora sp. KI3]
MAGYPDPAPLVFAHRGASFALPEHTLAAYRRALADGADGVECDVRLTRDGHLVCLHDRRLDRVSDGRGPMAGLTLAQLRAYDFGSWHPGGSPAEVLTLDDLLDTLREAGRPVRLLVETKHPNRYGKAVEYRLRAQLNRHGLTSGAQPRLKVTVMSFSPLAVRRSRELLPSLPTVQLMDLLPPGLRIRRLPFGTRIAGPGLELVRRRPDLVRRLKAGGHQVYVWTVNELDDVDLLLKLGVDGLITDRPAEVLSHLGR